MSYLKNHTKFTIVITTLITFTLLPLGVAYGEVPRGVCCKVGDVPTHLPNARECEKEEDKLDMSKCLDTGKVVCCKDGDNVDWATKATCDSIKDAEILKDRATGSQFRFAFI